MSEVSPSSADQTAPRGVTWLGLLVAALGLLVVLTALAAGGGYWAWTHLGAQAPVVNQHADIELPPELTVSADVTNTVKIKLDHTLAVRVPIQQDLSIPIKDPIALQVKLDTEIPLKLDVPVDHVLHIDQSFDLDTTVTAKVLGINFDVPVKAKVPLKADVPVNLVIPVRKQLPLSLTLPATVRIGEPIQTHIDTVFDARVPVRADLALPVTAPVGARLTFPQKVVTVGVQRIDAHLPLQAITLGLNQPAEPLAPSTAVSGASRP